MKRLISLLIVSALLLLMFSACGNAPEDISESITDSNGNITVSDSDDNDLSTIDEENEIKTGSNGSGAGSNTGTSDSASEGNTVGTGSGSGSNTANGDNSSTGSTDVSDPGISEPAVPEITVNLTKQTVTDPSYAVFENNTLKILKSADFSITGNFYGCIEASLGYNDVLRLKLSGANILNTTGPAIKIYNLVSDEKNDSVANNPDDETTIAGDLGIEYDQPDVIVSFTDGTSSTLEVRDCNLNDMIGTIYSEVSLSIRGHGDGIIKNANQNAVHCLKSVEVRNVNSLQLLAPNGRGVYTKARYTNNAGATVKISSKRDAIKCDKFYMSGGVLIACSQSNDAIDADDRAVITDGILVADTADIAKNYGIKVRRILENQIRPDKYDTFELSGGTVVATGGFNTLPSSDTSTAAYYSLGSNVATGATSIAVKNSSGNALLAFKTGDARPAILIASPSLSSDTGYSVWNGGSITGAEEYFINDNIIVTGTRICIGGNYSGGKKITDIS